MTLKNSNKILNPFSVLSVSQTGNRHGNSIGCMSVWYAGGCRFNPHVRQHSVLEIGSEIISTAILSFPLIQEGQLSVTGEIMCTKY